MRTFKDILRAWHRRKPKIGVPVKQAETHLACAVIKRQHEDLRLVMRAFKRYVKVVAKDLRPEDQDDFAFNVISEYVEEAQRSETDRNHDSWILTKED